MKFDVSDAKGDSIKVKYDLPSRSDVPSARIRDIPIHGPNR
jgi:hypothetical protein